MIGFPRLGLYSVLICERDLCTIRTISTVNNNTLSFFRCTISQIHKKEEKRKVKIDITSRNLLPV